MSASTTTPATTTISSSSPPSWSDLQSTSIGTTVGSALRVEAERRQAGHGAPHVHSTLRLFHNDNDNNHDDKSKTLPKLTLYRDHAGWCPYCQKTMLLIEEKQIPINIELINMRSYGDKPTEFMRMVPGGLLPALTVEPREEEENGDQTKRQVITESQVIMELLDQWFTKDKGYKPMLPHESDRDGWAKYEYLTRLERELFSWWCTFMFRPEGGISKLGGIGGGGGGNILNMLTGKGTKSGGSGTTTTSDIATSPSMKGFLDCLRKVDDALTSTSGPWFFDQHDYPTMIDFIYVSHVERMLASCAYWKGLDLRLAMKKDFPGITAWFDAFDKRECYLAFKSDYYTHVMDIPPQYGPAYDGGLEKERKILSQMINGRDGKSWHLPLPHDDPLQPLYRGPPLPLCVLEAVGISADNDGTYEKADPNTMAKACRHMAGWKLAGNGNNVSRFASRGGSGGSRNMRKTFGAPLADPYAEPDEDAKPYVDAALRVVCSALLDESDDHDAMLSMLVGTLQSAVPPNMIADVQGSLAYLRDRVGVPRDLPLASARQLRAHLNWAIDSIAE